MEPDPFAQDAASAQVEEIGELREAVEANAERVAKLGEWPAYIQPGSMLERIPNAGDENAPGFDAGIACALDLIPRERQSLAAHLHANYSKEKVLQVLSELKEKNPDSETMWWLAACSVCKEGGIDAAAFVQQVKDFKELAADENQRKAAAEREYEHMSSSYELKEGVPFGTKDGCMQGAYIDGYTFASMYSDMYGLYFIGTYEPSLGLEDFAWSTEKDEKGRDKSGPVFGSKQFVKCSSEEEWRRAMAVVKAKLPLRQDIAD